MEPVVAERVEPLASLFSETEAPDTTAPLGSVTVPVISPVTSDWAIIDGAITAAITSTAKIPVISLFAVISPLKILPLESITVFLILRHFQLWVGVALTVKLTSSQTARKDLYMSGNK